MTPTPAPRQNDAARRKSVRRTALWIGLIAVGIYVAFILSGVLGQ
ncbi:MAG: hypothetical protein ACREO4_01570 [Lysobacter sp.]